jgi:hypothetical protein
MNNKTIVSKLAAVLEVTCVYFGLIWIPGRFMKMELWWFDL